MKIQLGKIKLKNNIILAPMSGVTDMPYRKLVHKFGAGLVVSEMIASRSMINHTKDAFRRAKVDIFSNNACVQLAGFEPDVIAQAAKMNEDMGAKIIDLNFGCPAKKIVNGYAGSALMKDEKLAQEIFEITVKAVKIPVTVKMRLGWDANTKNAPHLAKIAENSGIQMVTVHARTRSQFFSGKADWSLVAQVKDVLRIPLIVNGDIVNYHTAQEALRLSRADGIMIGRGCYGRPWLLNQIAHFLETGKEIPNPSLENQLSIILNHYDLILEHYGDILGIQIARKHLGWYSKGINNSSIFRSRVNQLQNPEKVKDFIIDFYSSNFQH